MIPRPLPYKHLAAALTLGLALRLFFIHYFPFYSGDTFYYEALARNWLYHGIYGLFFDGHLTPVDMRVPGYPAFLAAIYALLGNTRTAVMLVQALLDLLTCCIAALLAARLAPASARSRVFTIALWLAALCPFTANYTAVVMTETLATFFTTLALLAIVYILERPSLTLPVSSLDQTSLDGTALFSQAGWWLLAGFLVGAGTLVRPEAPLLLAAAGLALVVRWRRRADWTKLAFAGLWMAVGLLLPLAPWAVRNARVLGHAEFLAPRFAETREDFIPRGFYAWTQTWMVRFGEAYLVTWKLWKEPIRIETLPAAAIDSAEERARVAALLNRYNSSLKITPGLDRDFAALARERAARRPLRTYLCIPLQRAVMIWFTPRIELLPYSGKLWPPGEKWKANRADFSFTLGFGILNFALIGLAVAGAWRCRHHPAWTFLLAFLVLRTAFLTQLITVEPRYVVACFPLIIAFASLALSPRRNNPR
jgi:4-amino-4-deoxy-L-arabinose transferase-like glycosyltransferase